MDGRMNAYTKAHKYVRKHVCMYMVVLCRVAARKSFPVHHHSAGYILFPFGSLSKSWLFRKLDTA